MKVGHVYTKDRSVSRSKNEDQPKSRPLGAIQKRGLIRLFIRGHIGASSPAQAERKLFMTPGTQLPVSTPADILSLPQASSDT